MSNIDSLCNNFLSFHILQPRIPTILAGLQDGTGLAWSMLLNKIAQVLSSKHSPIFQKFYALYFILKAVESNDERLINALAVQDELLTTIFHAGQTDLSKTGLPFERGTKFFSQNPTSKQAKSGINFVKLSIELICYLGCTYGVSDQKCPRYVYTFLATTLEKKTKVPKTRWFLDKEYIIPEGKELYCWDFGHLSPLVASEEKEKPENKQEEAKPKKKSKLKSKAKALLRLRTLPTSKNLKEGDLNPDSSSSYESGSEDDSQDEDSFEEVPDEQDDMILTRTPRQSRFSSLGLVDRTEQLRQSSKMFSNPLRMMEEVNQDNVRPSFSPILTHLRTKVNEPELDNAHTEHTLTRLMTGTVGTLEKQGVLKKSWTRDLSVSKQVSWADGENSPLFGEPEDSKEKSPIQRTATQELTFNLLQNNQLEAIENRPSQPQEEVQKNVPIKRKATREVTFRETQNDQVEVVQGIPLPPQQEELEQTKGNYATGNQDTANSDRKKKIISRLKSMEAGECGDKNTEENKKQGKINGRATGAVSMSWISDTFKQKAFGPKDIEENLSVTLSKSAIKSHKTPHLEEDLLGIRNSIRQSMTLLSNSANKLNAKSINTEETLERRPMTKSFVFNGSRISIEKDIWVPNDTHRHEQQLRGSLCYLDHSNVPTRKASEMISSIVSCESQVLKKGVGLDRDYKSETNTCVDTNKGSRRDIAKDDLSEWKCIVVEKVAASNQGSFLHQLNMSATTPKMYSITNLREIEIREQLKSGEMVKEDVYRSTPGKENSNPNQVGKGRIESIHSNQGNSNRIAELLAPYSVMSHNPMQCNQLDSKEMMQGKRRRIVNF